MANRFSKIYRRILRFNLNKKNKSLLHNTDFTIISSSCVGGVIYHELGLEFLSPTINLFLYPKDFIKFCDNLSHYLSIDEMRVSNDDSGYGYPVMCLDDLKLYCVHYKTPEEVVRKWNVRKARVNMDNIFLIMTERDGCSEADLEAFDRLEYKNKVVFVHKHYPNIKSAVYIPGTELDGNDGNWVRDLNAYCHKFTGKRYIDGFDYVTFLNGK